MLNIFFYIYTYIYIFFLYIGLNILSSQKEASHKWGTKFFGKMRVHARNMHAININRLPLTLWTQ